MTGCPRMVVLDLDDTLYPEAEFVRGGFRAAGARLDALEGRATGAARVFLDILEREGVSRVFDKGLAALGLPCDPEQVADLVRAFRGHTPDVRPFPGVPEMLDRLRARGLRLGLLSDGPLAVQEAKWKALGLGGRFEVVVFTDALGGRGTWKPHPAGFEAVERLSGLAGPDLCMVGDRPRHDLVPAAARGWRTVRMRWPGAYHAADPDSDPGRRVATSLADLERLILGGLTGA